MLCNYSIVVIPLVQFYVVLCETLIEFHCDVTTRMQLSFGKSFQNNGLCTG